MSDQNLGDALKQGMRNFASGVCVITARSESGERVAMTASSVTSVSAEPPSLLVCVNKSASADAVLATTTGFTVNVLSAGQQDVSNTCASPAEGDSRFDVGNWVIDEATGLSYLSDALTTFFCTKTQSVPYGTHNIYIGEITKVALGESDEGILIYAKGAYHSI